MHELNVSLSTVNLQGDSNFARLECDLLTDFIENQCEQTLPYSELHEICSNVIVNRICSSEFINSKPAKKWLFLIFRMCRSIFRDKKRVELFHVQEMHKQYVETFQSIATRFTRNEHEWSNVLINYLNVTQKLVDNGVNAEKFVLANLEHVVLMLLSTQQMSILQHSLEILGRLSDWSTSCREHLCESNSIDICLQLIPDGDILTQKLCVSLLRILSCEEQAREQIRIYDGVPILLGLLSIKNSRLQWHVAWTLAQLAEHLETANEIAQLGGISLILSEISNARAPADKSANDWIAMLTGLTALLAQLCQSSNNQHLITNSNGVYILGKVLTIRQFANANETKESWRLLQCSIFRVLRLLFILDRAKQLLKKVLETEIYEKFVDIGNYVHTLAEYEHVATLYDNNIEANAELAKEWEAVNERRQAMGEVGEFELLDQLGAGAFGCVYSVRKKTHTHTDMPAKLFALKEIFMTNLSDRELDKSFGDMISEVKIIKQQLRHPNIVRYRRIFVENHRLYIVMDLIQGTSLRDHIVTIKEKRETFEESKIWNMIVQMMLALRYLHKEKQIVHRDLKPNNIMITFNERVVITDFGLAKQKGVEYLKSAAGTIIYSCPEIVQNLPYGEKADIWSFGCCAYEMCQLAAAFNSTNMLTLAMQIVEAKYEPIGEQWSSDLSALISACLQPDPSDRPDIVRIASMVGPRVLSHLDELARQHTAPDDCNNYRPQSEHSKTDDSLNSSTNSYQRPSRSGKLPPIGPAANRRNYSMSAGETTTRKSLSNSTSLPRIATNRRRVQTCSTMHPIRSNSSTDLLGKSGENRKTDGLSMRTNALRPVQDPVLTILNQMRRILVVTEKDASNTVVNHQRRLVEMFRKKLLARDSTADAMKMHLRKLAAESSDEIDMNLGFADFRPVLAQSHLNGYQKDKKVTRITYEQLAGCIQSLLAEQSST